MGSINVAIIGVGNCASSLVQGVTKYADATSNDEVPGLMHPVLGEYGIGDINFVAAFDVDSTKVGLDLSEAIFAKPNNTKKFQKVQHSEVTVSRGMTHDGADSVAGDPLTHLAFSPAAHGHAAARLVDLANRHCDGRILATGGGGYNRNNLAAAWTEVVKALLR